MHQGTIVVHEHPHLGAIREPRPAPLMSATPLRVSGRDSGPHAPLYGEHTAEVMREAGFSEAEIGRMREEGAFGRGAIRELPGACHMRAASARGRRWREPGGT